MARESITIEQVIGAAESIQAEGGKATARAVRDRLGTGSMGTVNRMLQEWRGDKKPSEAATSLMPPALQSALMGWMQEQINLVHGEYQADMGEQGFTILELQKDSERAQARIENLEGIMDSQSDQISTQRGKIEALQTALDGAEAERVMEARNASAAREALAVASLRLEALPKLEKDLQETRAMLEHEHQARIQAEQAAAVFEAQLDGMAQMLEEVKTAAAREKGELAKSALQAASAYQREKDLLQLQLQELKQQAPLAKPTKVTGSTTSGKNKTALPYRHPDELNLTWSGKGKQPAWVQEWIKAGNSLESLKQRSHHG